MKLVQLVLDYAPGDLAISEVVGALAQYLPDDYQWHATSVASFDTVATGFILAQIGLRACEKKCIVYANCAPRKDRADARQNNEGEGLLYGVLANGVPVVVVNSGYSLSFVREELRELYTTKVEKGGSQFRSRDIFPPVVGKVAAGEFDFIGERLDPEKVIPAPPKSVIGYVDSFGNIKTTVRDCDPELRGLEPGQRITAIINGTERTLTVASGSFNVREGDIAFSPGSSGHGRRFWEIFQRGGSAWHSYGCPRVGASITLAR